MKIMILIFAFFLSFCALSAKEQIIEIKVSGGIERPALKNAGKIKGEPYIGYNDYKLRQENQYGNITLQCGGEGWEICELDSNSVTLKCAYMDLLKLAFNKIKKGVKKGTFTDEITEDKKHYTRTVKWSSKGLYKSSKITIILDNC